MNPFLQALTGRNIKATAYDSKFLQTQQQQKAVVGTDYLGRTNYLNLAGVGNNSVNWLGTGNYTRDGYSAHGVCYSVINYILSTSKQIPWAVYSLDAKGAKKKLLENHELTNLLWRPNPKMTIGELSELLELHLLTTGNAYLWANRVTGNRIAELWVLPHTTEVLGGGYMQEVQGYKVTHENGKQEVFQPEDVIHYKYVNPDNSRYGLSPIRAGYKIITAADKGLDLRNKQYENNGPGGLLYHDDANAEPLDATQVNSLRSRIKSFFSPRRHQYDIPFSDSKLGYVQLGLSPVDLKVLEAADVDKNGICDLYRFPGHLLNGRNGSTYSNVAEASKGLYTKCVIPLKRQIQEKLNLFLTKEYKDKVFIDIDLSGIAELQDDKKELVEYLKEAWWMSTAERQAAMGVEVNPNLPQYLIPKNLVPYDGKTPLVATI